MAWQCCLQSRKSGGAMTDFQLAVHPHSTFTFTFTSLYRLYTTVELHPRPLYIVHIYMFPFISSNFCCFPLRRRGSIGGRVEVTYIFYILLLSFPTLRSRLCRVPSSFPGLSNSQVGTCTTERGSGYCLFWFIYFLRSRTGQTVYSIQEGGLLDGKAGFIFIFCLFVFLLLGGVSVELTRVESSWVLGGIIYRGQRM